MNERQDIDYSALTLPGAKWWQERRFKLILSISTLMYAVLLLVVVIFHTTSKELMDGIAALTTFYIITLTVTGAAMSTQAGSKLSQNRLTHFAQDNNFAFENFSRSNGASGAAGLNITTNSLLLETLHHVHNTIDSNKKIWELRGDYDSTPFRLYTLLMGIKIRGGLRWHYASVIEISLDEAKPSFIALSKNDWLSSYLSENKMNQASLQLIIDPDALKHKPEYLYYRQTQRAEPTEPPKHLVEPIAAIDSRSIEVSKENIFIIRNGSFHIDEKEMRQAFQLIDKAIHTIRNDSMR